MNYPMKATILGTEYTIEKHKYDEDHELGDLGGYCEYINPLIVVGDLTTYKPLEGAKKETLEMMEKETLRHEIIHAFLNESGLGQNAFASSEIPWSQNEEMVDWIAMQFPKIAKTYEELGIM